MSRNTDPKPTTYAEWEDLEEERDQLRADRDRLAAELARVRRNHLRRMEEAVWPHIDSITNPPGSLPHKEYMIRRRRQWNKADRLHQLRHRIRAALAQPQDGTTEGKG